MSDSERQQILDGLKQGGEALAGALAGVEEELAARWPGPGRWSILQCVEHVAVSEQFLLSRLKQAAPVEQSPASPARERMILARAQDRTRPVASPEGGLPTGRYRTLAEALAAFQAARAEAMQWVEGFDGDLRFWLTDHTLSCGPLTCYEVLLLMLAHPVRHARQIQEIRGV